MQQRILGKVNDDRLRAYVVWEPILPEDHESVAQESAAFVPDARARHFWANGLRLGASFSPIVGLDKGPAWDVYLVYAGDAVWGEKPPTPKFWMHQLHGRLSDLRLLDTWKLLDRVRDLLK